MKKTLLTVLSLCGIALAVLLIKESDDSKNEITHNSESSKPIKKKKTQAERALFNKARVEDEFNRLQDPNLGYIPKIEQAKELSSAQSATLKGAKQKSVAATATYTNRGPSNLGGRTRTIVVDRSDVTGNTIIAGGVSGGVFRTTNGGISWTRVSPYDDIHNVTTIIQDPRNGFEDTWYYGTGESLSGSPSNGASTYLGRGIWQSTDGGLNWSQFTDTNSSQENIDSPFDFVYNLAIDPTTGYLYAAVFGQILIYLPSPPVVNADWYLVQGADSCCSTSQPTDISITSSGDIYMAIGGGGANSGIWKTNNANIFSSTAPMHISNSEFTPAGRIVLDIADSSENKVYTLFENGDISDCSGTPAIEADLYMWNETNDTWTNFSSKLPDETDCLEGNDPFSVQGGYNLTISIKPDDADFIVIGGTNAYKMEDITTSGTFTRIGGYASSSNYNVYSVGGTEHHADIHALVFNPFNTDELFSGTDGGIHKTSDIEAVSVAWTSLNNNYQTQQYYYVAIDPETGSDFVLGGLQDNGTNMGGTSVGESNLTEQTRVFSGDGVAVAISRDNINVPTFVGTQWGSIYRRNKNAPSQTGTEITPSGSNSQFVTYFYLDPDNNKTLYYAGENTVYRTNNSSSVTAGSWTDMKTPNDITDGGTATEWPQIFSTTRGVYSAASYLLIGTNEGNIYKLVDPQNATDISGAVKITPSEATTSASTYVSGLAIHPTNPNIVLATYSNYGSSVKNIFLSTNANTASPTWTEVENILSAHSIRSAAIVEAAGETQYFVGTGRGLYSSSDPTTENWVREAPNQIGFAIVRTLAYRPADNHLLIGTHGNGMFEATITGTLGINAINNISDDISIYPNPVNNFINLKTKSQLDNDSKYIITNISGQSVLNGEITNNKINTSQLTSGIYFISIKTSNGISIKKFIKN